MAGTTHIAVNLLLIIAVTMQPGLAYGLKRGCSGGVSSGFACQGCGCCKVQSGAAKCPCCSGETTEEEGGCCGDDRHSEDPVAESADDPFTGLKLEKGPVSDSAEPEEAGQPHSEDDAQVQANHVAALATVCHCATAPEPLDAPLPRSPNSELRDVLMLDVTGVGDVAMFQQRPLSGSVEFARRPMEPHFSQIAFCVWRL